MNADSGVSLKALKVDGGMVHNDLLMQIQADVLGVPVVRPKIAETTALGAAHAAGLAVGFWKDTEEMRANWGVDKTWEPSQDDRARTTLYKEWRKPLVARSTGWSRNFRADVIRAREVWRDSGARRRGFARLDSDEVCR